MEIWVQWEQRVGDKREIVVERREGAEGRVREWGQTG